VDSEGSEQLFPATIRGVRHVRSSDGRTELEIDHREGFVPNIMVEVAPDRIDLWEAKRRYDARFENRFEPVPEGTRYTVSADVRLKGVATLLAPVLGPYVRRQLAQFVLRPVRLAAEARGDATATTEAAARRGPARSRFGRLHRDRAVSRLLLISRLLVALTLGLAFAHVLEFFGKQRPSARDWLMVQQHLYVAFGAVGGPIELAAIALTWTAWLVT
jgi:hypothetical protein